MSIYDLNQIYLQKRKIQEAREKARKERLERICGKYGNPYDLNSVGVRIKMYHGNKN